MTGLTRLTYDVMDSDFAYRAWRDLNKTPKEIAARLQRPVAWVRAKIKMVGEAIGGPTPESRARDAEKRAKVPG